MRGRCLGALLASASLMLAGCGGGSQAKPTGHGPARLALTLGVRRAGAHIWQPRFTARPGQALEHRIEVANVGGAEAMHVCVRVKLAGGERPVFASGHIATMGVTVATGRALPPGLFGRGVLLGPLPGGGTVAVITYRMRAGRRSFSERVLVRWQGGRVSASTPVTVTR